MASELTVAENTETSLSCENVMAQVQQIQQILKSVMKKGEHYGTIPGCGDKPTLLKSGAEKLCLTFRMAPSYPVNERTDLPGGHREVNIVCELRHIASGNVLGQGVGCCSTMEGKYRYRTQATGYEVPKVYWETRDPNALGGPQFSSKKVNGVWMIVEKIEHDNPADFFNTVLKMAKKRALVDAALTATAASDLFTQDIEDMPEVIDGEASQGAAPSAPSTPPFGAPVFKFGQCKGKLLSDPTATLDQLEWYGQALAKSLLDPDKTKWKTQNEAHIAEVRAEYTRRTATQETPEPPADEPVDADFEDLPVGNLQQ